MALREFIRQEIREDHVFDIEEFGTKVPRGCDKWDAYHREIERRELEDEIKQCDLNMLAMSRDKIDPDDVFRTFYLQRSYLLRQYRNKYGLEAEYQLRDQLYGARKAYVAQYEAEDKRIRDLEKQVRLYREALEYYRDQLNEARDKAGILSYAIDIFTDRHPEYSAELKELIDHCESALEDDE